MIHNFKIHLIRDYILENKIGKTEFCKRCGISLKTLNKILSCEGDVNFSTLIKITKVLNIQIFEFFEKNNHFRLK